MKKRVILLLIVGLFLCGCVKQQKESTDVPKEVVVISGVTIAPWPMKTVAVGDRQTFNAIITPVNATNQNVTWTSSDPSVATIDSSGNMRALKVGKTNITAITDAGNYTSTCLINVVDRNEVGGMTSLEVGAYEEDEIEYPDSTDIIDNN